MINWPNSTTEILSKQPTYSLFESIVYVTNNSKICFNYFLSLLNLIVSRIEINTSLFATTSYWRGVPTSQRLNHFVTFQTKKITSGQRMQTNSTHQDSDQGVINLPETLLQDSQRKHTRNSYCLQQGCMICCTPTDHVRNLKAALNAPNMPSLPTTSSRPQPPAKH